MGERLLCKQEVIGSIPFSSTKTGREIGEAARAARVRRHSARRSRYPDMVVEEARGWPRAIGFEPGRRGAMFDMVNRLCDRGGGPAGLPGMTLWVVSLVTRTELRIGIRSCA